MIDVRLSEAFVQGILNGEFDSELDSISDALGLRRRAVAMAQGSSIRTGDRVRVVRVTPKYLKGIEGIVTGRVEKGLTVKIDNRFNTGRYSHNLTLGYGSLERISESESESDSNGD